MTERVEEALRFVSDNHRAVLITQKADGSVQSSPVTAGIDDDDKIVISSRETAYKVRNLRRRPTATLCAFTDRFFGPWLQIDGSVDILALPDAMEPLVDYYRRISGEHPDWDEYRSVMEQEQRVLIRLSIDSVGPTKSG